jgi:hypothetical protein
VKYLCKGLLGWVVLCLVCVIRAAQLPAEQLLPAETTLMFTIKDSEQASANFWVSNLGQLWSDDVMRPSREKFSGRWTNEVVNPIQRDLKLKLSDYIDLMRGQFTLALTPPVVEGKTPGFVVLIDSKDKAELLKTNLAELKKKWNETDRKPKTEKIRDIEFTSYEFTQATLQKFVRTIMGKAPDAAPDPEAEKTKINLLVGQSQSLLILGNQARDVEKILARQSGAAVPTIAEQPVFQGNYNALFRDAPMFGWLDFKPIFDQIVNPHGAVAAATQFKGIENLRLQKILPALGLGEIKSIALRMNMGASGFDSTFFITVPEANRHGLLKIIAPPAKDASPPPFVPADAVKFRRVRIIDFQQAWDSFEKALVKIDPSVAGVVQLLLSAAGKDKDSNFDLKKALLDSVGDDLITYEKAPKNGVAPTISLIGARNPEALLNCIRAILRLVPDPPTFKEREFIGRKIYSASLTPPGVPAQPGAELHLATTASYVAVARDAAMIEEFLRSAEAPPKPLRDLPGFNDATQKVGGMNTGWFSFENEIETMRGVIDDAKKNPDTEPDSAIYNLKLIASRSSIAADWIDYATLPPFESIAKYFYYSLLTGTATPEGISFKIAAPNPPALK